jgi:dTDP-4-amino-4,6-dideoxygalactose transaminase
MIPRHAPPFDLIDLFKVLLLNPGRVTVEQLEKKYAEACGFPYAILLPSARAGIAWALQATVTSDTEIYCPAYTCNVVHEAVCKSKAKVTLLDTAEDSFLMDVARFKRENSDDYALVLSELYGHEYNLPDWVKDIKPRVRIVDTAMTVADATVFHRLENSDFAVISFGIGKCLYAGWGGMGFTRDHELAAKVRGRRDASVQKEEQLLIWKRMMEIFFRTLMHTRSLYGLSRKAKETIEKRLTRHLLHEDQSGTSTSSSLSREYYLPSTRIDRSLINFNMERRHQLYDQRTRLRMRYDVNLTGRKDILLPPKSTNALSHYTVRVPAARREAIRKQMWKLGVDAGKLFPSPSILAAQEFPNAYQLSQTVLNLPLDAHLKVDDIDFISEILIRSIDQ